MKKDKRYQKIDQISQSFCLAKWLQVTIDLKHGTNHSCHHPERHIIPTELVESKPDVLHNTPFKKRQRKLMLEGARPPECSYCWTVEDAPGDHISDRYIKSTDPWAWDSLEKISKLPWDQDINPTYVEVMFDSICNLSCSYCMADISTSIMKEMKEHGPYPVTDQKHRMPKHADRVDDVENVFQKAFWKWLPTLSDDLQVLRITGGEPLLSPQNDKLLDFFDQHIFNKLELIINSNLSMPTEFVRGKLERVRKLVESKKVAGFELYTSLDAYDAAAVYIRNGLNHDLFWKNIELVHDIFPESQIVIMCAYNVLSMGNFDELIEKVKGFKQRGIKLVLDLSYVKNPFYLRANLATDDLKLKLEGSYALMKALCAQGIFSAHELSKFETVFNWVKSPSEQKDILRGRRDFFSFINEYDKRKKTDFRTTFPLYESFYKTCHKIYEFTEADRLASKK